MSLPGKTGKRGEDFAARVLEGMGYEILVRNYHCRAGEIDIIAAGGGFICFVEVKARRKNSMVGGFEAVTPAKQRKLIETALHYMQQHPTRLQPRFDVFSVELEGEQARGYDYLTGAFDAYGY